jgi:hypothetical protein
VSEIREFVLQEPLFDNHEHQGGFSGIENRRDEINYREFLGYSGADLETAAAGFGKGNRPDMESDEGFFEAWAPVRTTGYGRATEMGCRAVLGLDFTLENVPDLNEAMAAFLKDKDAPAVYESLFGTANVRWVANDCCWDSPTKLDVFDGSNHPAFFGQALRYDMVLTVGNRNQVQGWEPVLGCPLQRLGDLDRALDDYTQKARDRGKLIAMKSAMPYLRRLDFENSSFADAERAFESLMQGRSADLKPLHDYLFHRFVQRAREFDLPVQLHTGYLAGNWGDPTQGDPTPLVPFLQRYRNVRFDLFHAGWPYSEILGAIGKSLPNVWLDMCWAWAMNTAQMERILREWLAGVPHNKIFAFGADTGSPFCTVCYAMQAREGIARVLEAMVADGDCGLETAKQAATCIMHRNARTLYQMD